MGSRRAEQLSFRSQQHIVATVEDSVLRTEMTGLESQEEDVKPKAEDGVDGWGVSGWDIVVYYESLKRDLKTKTIYGLRRDERLKTKFEESTRLGCTLLCAELEHLKIETRLTSETPVSEMGEYVSVML